MLYRFAGLILRPKQQVLLSGASVVPLPPKAVSVLIVLMDRVGQVVSRDTLREEVWNETFVEDTAITRSVSLLRTTLAPYLEEGEGIETISKRGYRLTVAVTLIDESEVPALPPASAGRSAEADSAAYAAAASAASASGLSVSEPLLEQRANVAGPVSAPDGKEIKSAGPRRRDLPLWGLVAALITFILLVLIGYSVYRSEHVHAQQDELAVVDLRDLSSTPDASWMGVAIEESLSQELSRDGGISALAGSQVAVAEEDLGLSHARTFDTAELDQLERRLGVDYLLSGTYMPMGEQVRVDLILHKGDSVVTEVSETVEQQDMQAALERASAKMRASLRLPQAQTGGELQYFSKDQLAAHFYAEGLRLSRTGDTPRLAREAFSKAVQADLHFAEAHAALAVAWLKVGHEADARAEAQLALDTCASLPETRRLSLQGTAYRLVGSEPKALEALARLRQLHPEDSSYKLRMASTLFDMNKYAEAAVILREMEADKTRRPNLTALTLLATTLTQQGDRSAKFLYADKIMKAAKAEGSRSAEAKAHLFAGMGWMGALDGAKAVAEFKQGEDLSATIGDKVGIIAALTDETAARSAFHLPGAIDVGQRAIDMATEIGEDGSVASGCINLGGVAMDASQLRSALSYFKRALELGEASQDKSVRLAATDGLVSVYLLSENLGAAEKTAALQMQYAYETRSSRDLGDALQHVAQVNSYLGRWALAETNYKEAVASFQSGGNTRASNDLLVEYSWMLAQRGQGDRAAEILRTVDRRVLLDDETLAGYEEGHLESDPVQAEMVVEKMLAKELVPSRKAIGLGVLMDIAVREKNVTKAHAAADRFVALAQSIPEDGVVRRGAVLAVARAEILAGNRSAEAVRALPGVLREATRLHHAVEVAELERVLAEVRQ